MNLNQYIKEQISSALLDSNSINLILGSNSTTLSALLDNINNNQRKHLTIPSDIINSSEPYEVWATVTRIKDSGRDVVLVFNHLEQLVQHESAIHQFQLTSKKAMTDSTRFGAIFLLLTNTNQSDLTPAIQRCVDTMFIDS